MDIAVEKQKILAYNVHDICTISSLSRRIRGSKQIVCCLLVFLVHVLNHGFYGYIFMENIVL